MLWTALLLTGCSQTSTGVVGELPIHKRIIESNALDLLFVIDNSPSTADKQTVFNQNFAHFVQALDAFPQGRPDVHIGVVNTTVDLHAVMLPPMNCPSPDPWDDGVLQNTGRIAGCAIPNGRYISDVSNGSGGRTTNYTGTLESAFTCIAELGTSGCGIEAPLEAMKRALDGSRPENAGFLRDDAYLAVVILTDEDDASVLDPSIFASLPGSDFPAQPQNAYHCDTPIVQAPGSYTNCTADISNSAYANPHDYAQFLSTIKDPSQTLVAVIGGPPSSSISVGPLTIDGFVQALALQPTCSAVINGNPAIARPANRLDVFRSSFDELGHGVFASACQADYSGALAQIGTTAFQMMSPCLEGAIDTSDRDPVMPGIQLACDVELVANVAGPPQRTKLAACPMIDANTPSPNAAAPCYWVRPDASCSTTSRLAIETVLPQPLSATSAIDIDCTRAP